METRSGFKNRGDNYELNLLVPSFSRLLFFLVPVLQQRVGLRRSSLVAEVGGVDALLWKENPI